VRRGSLLPLLFLLAAGILRAVDLDVPVFAGGFGTGFYEETARRFEALRPGVRIHVHGDPRIGAQISVRVIGGNDPDLASSGDEVPWPALIRAGRVVDLAPYLRGPNWEGDARWGDTFLPGSLDAWKVDGKVGGLPCAYASWAIWYNKGMFRAHGWTVPGTWDEFFDLCGRMRAAGIAPLSLPGVAWHYQNAIFCAACYNLVGEDGWRAINALKPGARTDPRFVRAAAIEQRVLGECVLRGWQGESHTGAERAFLRGDTAMTISGSWIVNEMEGKIPDGFELGAMNFPVFSDGRGDPTAIQSGPDSFFVFASPDPQRVRLSVDFLRFMTSRERMGAFVRELNSPAPVRGVPLSAYGLRMRETARMILAARASYALPQAMMLPPELRQVLPGLGAELGSGRLTPAEYGARVEEAAASARARAADPNRVEMRHVVRGSLLLAAIAAVWIWIARGWLRRRARKDAVPAEDGSLGRMRPVVGLGFVAPALVPYALFIIGPAAASFAWAFTRWNGIGERSWSGLFNFRWLLFEDDLFWSALGNNAYLMIVPSLFVVPFALLCAALIHRGVRGAGFFRVVLLFPNMLGGIAAILLWMNIYQPHGGLANAFLSGAGRLLQVPGAARIDGFPWLAANHLYAALIPIYIWMACGFNLVLYLAAMEGIDPELYEAAEMDGAPAWRQFFSITLPMIREILTVSVVFLVIGGLNAFEMIWLLTGQDPMPQSHTLGTLLVTSMLRNFEVGRAAALAVILFVLVFAASAAVTRLLRREEPGS
jgi:ABC-type sugar transport system permease subunit/ABC-type glycerol-3-phosphate transport system substrate-binding protein